MGVTLNNGLPDLLFFSQKYRDLNVGSILQLGRQDTYFSFEQLVEKAQLFGVGLKEVIPNIVSNKWTGQNVIDDITLFSSLGFSKVDSLDFVAHEGANFVHDLNISVPESFHEKWDVIYDAGTLEHVFDLTTAFKNIHLMLKPNGFIIHELPTNDFVDHGFWQISPTALLDCYGINGYKILEAWVWVLEPEENLHTAAPRRYIYEPLQFRQLSIGKFPRGMAGVSFLARKGGSTNSFVMPIQGFYQEHWDLRGSSEIKSVSEPGGDLNLEFIELPSAPRPRGWIKPVAELFLTLGKLLRLQGLSDLGERLWRY